MTPIKARTIKPNQPGKSSTAPSVVPIAAQPDDAAHCVVLVMSMPSMSPIWVFVCASMTKVNPTTRPTVNKPMTTPLRSSKTPILVTEHPH